MCKGQIDMTSTWMMCQLKKQKNSRGAANNAARRMKVEEKSICLMCEWGLLVP